LEDRFDVVTCIFDSLNYIVTPKALEVVLRGIRERTRPEGQFVFDINTLPGYRQKYVRSQAFEDDDGRWRVDVSTSFDEQTRICRWEVRGHLEEGGQRRSFAETHFQRGWEQCEIDRLLVRQGWEVSERLDGRDFQTARALSPRVIYLARPR
jgi:SAM-dependent methyltransferase